MDEHDIANIASILKNLGADDKAARVMAMQLLKRAEQIAEERSVSRVEALDYLLKVTIAGKEGRVYEEDPFKNGTTMRDERDKKG